jgi:hypothetical protein
MESSASDARRKPRGAKMAGGMIGKMLQARARDGHALYFARVLMRR